MRQRLGVRLRTALAAAAVVAVASVLTGAALVAAARHILDDGVDRSATDRAAQVAVTVGDGTGADLAAAVRTAPGDRTIVQVLDPDGSVTAASASVTGAGPISPLRPAAGRIAREDRRLAVARNEPFRVVATGVDTGGGVYVVLAAQSTDEIDDGTYAATGALLVGLPLLTLVVGVATFLFVGRSLRPVEAMRREAAAISATNLHRRLPVPDAADEIAALATTMNTMLQRIEAAATAQRRFVADASHELRSPLSTIHAGLDILEAAPLPDNAAAQVRRMHTESGRMAHLIDDLLLLARVDESGLGLRHEDVDLDDLVYAERDRIVAARPDLTVEVHVTPVRVSGDPHHLHRIVRNLVDNASRHARRRIVITLTGPGDGAELVVADDGPGIPEADRDRVFERFVRLDEGRSRDRGGAGLGLPIARELARVHGGTVTVGQAPDGGAEIHVTLCRRPDPAAWPGFTESSGATA
jgi:signal transduction histidine kinase